jgi:predicted MFS family arabinose efflux permease
MVAAIALMTGIVNSFDAPARLSLAVELVDDRRDLQNAIALNATMFNMARIVGPAIGGIALAALGAAWCFGLNGLTFLAVILALIGIRLPGLVGSRSSRRMGTELGEGVRYVWSNPTVRNIIALIAVSSLFAMSYGVLLPAYAVDVLQVGEAGLGALNTAVGVGALIGALSAATMSRNPNKGMQITVGSLIFPVSLVVLAFTRWLPVALVFLALAGFGFALQNAISNTLVQSTVPMAASRVTNVYSLMFFGPAFRVLAGGSVGAMVGYLGSRHQRRDFAGVALGCSSPLHSGGRSCWREMLRKSQSAHAC